jgi:hypothetical protein
MDMLHLQYLLPGDVYDLAEGKDFDGRIHNNKAIENGQKGRKVGLACGKSFRKMEFCRRASVDTIYA